MRIAVRYYLFLHLCYLYFIYQHIDKYYTVNSLRFLLFLYNPSYFSRFYNIEIILSLALTGCLLIDLSDIEEHQIYVVDEQLHSKSIRIMRILKYTLHSINQALTR